MSFDAYKNCTLCPRNCKVDRTRGKAGVCGETARLRISHIGAHFGEEPSFSGTRGSGTIFFSGCSSRCFFCQNYQISVGHEGREITPGAFLSEVKTLIGRKVHNLNFVTPDHFWPHIEDLCTSLRAEGIRVPTVFNSSGYQTTERVAEYADCMDMFMPDFKFAESELAQKCMGDVRYPEMALAAIRNMVKQKGFLEPWDPSGQCPAERGVLVRHLVLPGHAENSMKVLRLLHGEFGTGIPLSVMSQFHPVPECRKRHELERTVGVAEYNEVLEFVEALGFEKVYTQELREEAAFLPDFKDPEDPFPGHRKNQIRDHRPQTED